MKVFGERSVRWKTMPVFSGAGQNLSVTNDPVMKPMPSTSTGFAKVLSWREEIGITNGSSLTKRTK
jgi:hypothetical protein